MCVFHPVHKAVAQRLGGRELAAGIGQFADQPLRQQVRDALQRADIGNDTDIDFLNGEIGFR